MTTDLKLTVLSITDGDLEKAKVLYAWLTDEGGAVAVPDAAPKATRTKKEPKAEAPPKVEPETTTASTLDYATHVQPEVLKAAAISPENTLAIVKSYGVDHARKVPPEKFPELVARCQALVAEAGANG